MRVERGDDAVTVTDAEEEKISPNVTCTTTWRREADIHYVKDVLFFFFFLLLQPCHHDAQVRGSIKSETKRDILTI